MSAATNSIVLAREQLTECPKDLYIPPEALEILLDTFAGPLDLLLYLIKKNRFDILTVPVAEITRQYMAYINLLSILKLELAAEYLVMAALLTEIKSRWLLPPPTTCVIDDEQDPRAELIRRLKAYEQTKIAAEALDQLPQHERDFWWAAVPVATENLPKAQPEIALSALVNAFLKVIQQAKLYSKHTLVREKLSLPIRITQVMHRLRAQPSVDFTQLFSVKEGKAGVIITFIAILELLKQTLIELFYGTNQSLQIKLRSTGSI